MAQQESKNQNQGKSTPSTSGQSGAATQRSMDRRNAEHKTSADGLMDQVRSTAADAYGTATSKASEKLEEQKSTLTSGLSSVADNIRRLGRNLGEEGDDSGITKAAATYGDTAAEKLEQAARYFEHHDVEAIYRDVENLARQNPTIFVGGAFALGFLAARFFKSTNPRSFSGVRGNRRVSGNMASTPQTGNAAASRKTNPMGGGTPGTNL